MAPPTPKTEISSASYQRAIDEEIRSFGGELADFLSRAKCLDVSAIGTKEEKAELRVSSEGLSRFCSDLGEITLSQNREVAQLQNDTLEAFQWAEDAK